MHDGKNSRLEFLRQKKNSVKSGKVLKSRNSRKKTCAIERSEKSEIP